MITEKINYFETANNSNFDSVIEVVKNYLQLDNSIKKVAVFAANLNSVMKLKEHLSPFDISITVTTYAYGREFVKTISAEEKEIVIAETSSKEAKAQILNAGMNYIQGGMPFEPIRSCTGDHSTEMIVSTFETISKGLVHCVSAAIMTKENGYIDDDEKIIALSGDTAIVITPTIRRELFDGKFRIHKILCKPL